MAKTIISIIVGTILLFVWNAVSWMGLPFHSQTLNNIPDGALQLENMRNSMPESGVYHFPGLPEGAHARTMNQIENELKEGPRITMMVYKSGSTEFFDPMSFLMSLIYNLITVGLTYILISRLANKSMSNILTSCLIIALVSAFVSDFGLMNWYMFPLDYTMVNVLDKIIGFGLLGLLFGLYTFKQRETA